jgi:hypothetical protein
MEQSLSLSEFKVLAVLRRIIPDGKRRKISQANIARRAVVSESTVSRAVTAMHGVFLFRHPTDEGAGYEIEILPPPELIKKRGRS